MRALAIETSSRVGSVALVRDGQVISEDSFPHGLSNAAQMLPMIDRLCRAQQWKPEEIGTLHLSVGPGSFTGLRIGVTLVKTLALVTGAKITAVPTVRVLAEHAPDEAQHVIVVLDAKRGQIFTARFEWIDGRWAERVAARLDTLANMLTDAPRPVHLLGEGIPYHRDALAHAAGKIIVTPDSSWRPMASVVARIGTELAQAGHFTDPMTLAPLYLRRPEAEEKLESRQDQLGRPH